MAFNIHTMLSIPNCRCGKCDLLRKLIQFPKILRSEIAGMRYAWIQENGYFGQDWIEYIPAPHTTEHLNMATAASTPRHEVTPSTSETK